MYLRVPYDSGRFLTEELLFPQKGRCFTGLVGLYLKGKGRFVTPDGEISDNALMKSVYLMI